MIQGSVMCVVSLAVMESSTRKKSLKKVGVACNAEAEIGINEFECLKL